MCGENPCVCSPLDTETDTNKKQVCYIKTEKLINTKLPLLARRVRVINFKCTAGGSKNSSRVRPVSFYLEVVDAGSSTQGAGASAVPLVERVPGFRAQNFGCLIFLEVLDEGHGSKHTDQVVTTWTRGGRASPKQWLSRGNVPVFL